MLYHLLYPLHTTYSAFNVFRYITFRAALAALMALMISFLLGPILIRSLTAKQIGQPIREDGPSSHSAKAGTPTMGGSLIILALFLATVLLADITNLYVTLAMAVTVGFGAIGFADDALKLERKSSKGLTARTKMLLQLAVAFVAALVLYRVPDFSSVLGVPFFKNIRPDLGLWYIPFCMLVIVGASNAVNLTDGLDGLAIGPVMTAAGTYAFIAYVTGHLKLAEYLQIPYVAGVGELSIFCAAIVASGLGFLWFNAYPAQMFMGDVGSLSLGAALGIVAAMTKNEILLVIVGGVFVIEALSVIFQVLSYKLRRKRVFLMAPIHHHYELKGWPEPQIIVRFWIISIICSLVALSTLKLR
ncbi:MAG: phospho-N-acetylmuramoyl-pentapeptide-transferase [Deltaproteobacteria bacterium RIFCSPLOWO2_02_FULL_57_26]|nr:MAG: phospho-N-acetylmuramoyl-pentapeptide-transferase [Deltaproteobacteria bacterium RIFCSPLOWO2_02_FULL_57_26]